jgi:DNA ligase 1
MKLPTLYKKTNTGAIQFWTIGFAMHGSGFGRIETLYGQLGTDSPQVTEDVIENGKNIGKANETTPFEQAQSEAKSRWEKKKKSGYVESLEAAKAGETDELIEGGISPMLAHTFEKQGHKIKYPAAVQPKLDGIRCIAILKSGKCTLWSRTRKPITSCPHIIEEIENTFSQDIVLDGELYNHKFRSVSRKLVAIPEGHIEASGAEQGFEHIVHLVRQEEPDPQHTDVQYHIYDVVNGEKFFERNSLLKLIFNDDPKTNNYLIPVSTYTVQNEDQVAEYFDRFKSEDYEGAMLRNANGLYVNRRSADLIKVKEMQDSEFEIVGIEEGRGKLTGHVGAFVCKTEDGQEFKAKMSGSTERLKEYFDNHSLWRGKLLTVQFQDLTSYGIPRFPVGLRFKEDL